MNNPLSLMYYVTEKGTINHLQKDVARMYVCGQMALCIYDSALS